MNDRPKATGRSPPIIKEWLILIACFVGVLALLVIAEEPKRKKQAACEAQEGHVYLVDRNTWRGGSVCVVGERSHGR